MRGVFRRVSPAPSLHKQEMHLGRQELLLAVPPPPYDEAVHEGRPRSSEALREEEGVERRRQRSALVQEIEKHEIQRKVSAHRLATAKRRREAEKPVLPK